MSHTIQCPGFFAAAVAAGIKKKDALDLGMLYTRQPAVAVGMFTRNRVQAAPVRLTRSHLAGGRASAIIVNSGNANCCTGPQGERDARKMAQVAASGLGIAPEQVLVASTGVIGESLPMEKIAAAGQDLAAALRPDGFESLARAMMTTDTVPKLIERKAKIDGHIVTLVAVAKGAGMIRPDMATMLCFVCTDADIAHETLQQCLKKAVDSTLNRITIDGDTSTNDTILVMANGHSGAALTTSEHIRIFQQQLDDLLMDTARRLVRDGEGVTKVVEIKVQNAGSDSEAMRVVDTVAHSPLVKTAFFGEDANWGRIIAAAGRAGVPMDPHTIDLFFDGVQMVRSGQGCGAQAEALASEVLKKPEFCVTIDLHQGGGSARMLTCDLSVDYVKINADYRS